MAIESLASAGPPGSMLPVAQYQPRPLAQSGVATGATPESTSAAGAQAASANVVSAQAPTSITKTDVEDAVKKVQKVVEAQASNLLFSIDEDSGRTVVKVVDSSTNETIRQIPSEEVLSIAKALDKLQGLLLRQTA
ncbi:MAG TPA: flagellar protein FlaG [Aromatoleum sp.]|uniref:flagellar protein FlaG n=1 Tax=Aromatoleum sp. TaxID=2307007 RepID=UPI002B4A4E9F|nr:flagellar protein FlaG [Aromatoleum sp.]HJV26686.1 flagellar protein FlaG [Aromatoleum sp.]